VQVQLFEFFRRIFGAALAGREHRGVINWARAHGAHAIETIANRSVLE
jgi:hypothetical protein